MLIDGARKSGVQAKGLQCSVIFTLICDLRSFGCSVQNKVRELGGCATKICGAHGIAHLVGMAKQLAAEPLRSIAPILMGSNRNSDD